MDPCVLSVIAGPCGQPEGLDYAGFAPRILRAGGIEHARVVLQDVAFRLDVRSGSILDGPCRLTFLLAHDERLARLLVTVRRFDAALADQRPSAEPGATRLARIATALRVRDLRGEGASLRQVAEALWGPGDWPGPGDHRKSAVRRYVALSENLLAGGPRPIFSM